MESKKNRHVKWKILISIVALLKNFLLRQIRRRRRKMKVLKRIKEMCKSNIRNEKLQFR